MNPKSTASAWLARLVADMGALRAHPARTVVLLPSLSLVTLARQGWAQLVPSGFIPQFETTFSWASRLSQMQPWRAQGLDVRFDMAVDLLTAQTLLENAGMATQSDMLSSRLVEALYQLTPCAAAVVPAHRTAWHDGVRPQLKLGMEATVLHWEAALAQLALLWASSSRYVTDVLFDVVRPDEMQSPPSTSQFLVAGLDCLVIVQATLVEPLARALLARCSVKSITVLLQDDAVKGQSDDEAEKQSFQPMEPLNAPSRPPSVARLTAQACKDFEEEAERAAACVIRHIIAGRVPVALVANDRTTTRRVRAILGNQGVSLRDETGWILSTTRAAAHVMTALRACTWHASSDTVLDWLKHAPSADIDGDLVHLERALRRAALGQWQAWVAALNSNRVHSQANSFAKTSALTLRIESWRSTMSSPRRLSDWLTALAALLQGSGQWELLANDEAGDAVLTALHVTPHANAELTQSLVDQVFARRLSLHEFCQWVTSVLEAKSFVPQQVSEPQVTVLPFSQILGRRFGSLVMPGCDDVHFAASPETTGIWTTAQRLALGLPTREELQAQQHIVWQHALHHATGSDSPIDILWREFDDAGEPLQASPLVQIALLQRPFSEPPGIDQLKQPNQARYLDGDSDNRTQRLIQRAPTRKPNANGERLPVTRLSASAYEDLRRCPYRFFALRQLKLQESSELDTELTKRDYGTWLHAVLKAFHEDLKMHPTTDHEKRRQGLNLAAIDTAQRMGLGAGEFFPFEAGWPQMRDAYLVWLAKHEADGHRYEGGELRREQAIGSWVLFGTIDRWDVDCDGQSLLIDYKTESQGLTKKRVADPLEDTQLVFYAALMPDDTLRAAYLSLPDREPPQLIEQHEVTPARNELIEGILTDMQAIAHGAPLVAMGEEGVCLHCVARGLCRKDFWEKEGAV